MTKSFSLFHTTYIEDTKEFFNGLFFFVQNLFHLKRFSNQIVLKFSKNVKLKIVNDPTIGQNRFKIFKKCGIKDCKSPENRIRCGMKD